MRKYLQLLKTKWFIFGGGLILGALIILGIRYTAYKPPAQVHYHANFAVYVNGQREKFQAMDYYEETAATSCSIKESDQSENKPMARTHMHGNVDDVVHVEDKLVTWGNFFTVLGWNVGGNYIATRGTVYEAGDQNTVTYILNGKKVGNITNTIIGDQDRLLVDYGSQTQEQINQEYASIQNNALKADNSKDPASCGSHEGKTTFKDRMKHLFN